MSERTVLRLNKLRPIQVCFVQVYDALGKQLEKIIEFGEKTTKFILLNGDEVTIDNNQKLTRNSNGYIVIKA